MCLKKRGIYKMPTELEIEDNRNYTRFVLRQGGHDELKDILGLLQANLILKIGIIHTTQMPSKYRSCYTKFLWTELM